VRVHSHSCPELLGPRVLAPALRVRNEVTLLGRVAFDEAGASIAGERPLQRVVRREQPAPVCNVFTLRQLAVDVEGVDLDVLIELLLDERGLRDEPGGVRRLPPVPQIPGGVVMAAFIVEAMRQLVAGPAAAK